jgi:hypothetical protein
MTKMLNRRHVTRSDFMNPTGNGDRKGLGGLERSAARRAGVLAALCVSCGAWGPLVAGCSSTDTAPGSQIDAAPSAEAEAGDEQTVEAAPDSSPQADAAVDSPSDGWLDEERGDGDWPPETCGRGAQFVCDFAVPDCDGTRTFTLYEYRNSAQWNKGVFIVRLAFDDPDYYDMAAWADWIAPTYESLGIKFLMVAGYAKETEIPATTAECNAYMQTAGGGLINSTVLRDTVGPGSVNTAFQCSTPYCYMIVRSDMQLAYGLCGRYNFASGPDVQAALEGRLDNLVAGVED